MMKDNDMLFEMRKKAEKTLALIEMINEAFPENKNENTILAIMASNFDSFWEGYNWHKNDNLKRTEALMRDFASRFYASDYYDQRNADIKIFLQSQDYKYE